MEDKVVRSGRETTAMREIRIEPNFLSTATGSALVSFGRTRVLCAVTVAESVPRWMSGQGRGWLTAEYAMMPASSSRRVPRERGNVKGRTQEIQRLIGRSLRAAVDLDALGERTLHVDCDVLEADGGTRTASITGAWVALSLALRRIPDLEVPVEKILHRQIAAVSVGVVDGVVLSDLEYTEDSKAEVDMNLVMDETGAYIEVQGTAEGAPFDRDALNVMLDVGAGSIVELIQQQRDAVARGAGEI